MARKLAPRRGRSAQQAAKAEGAKWAQVQCGYCRGGGRDPFGIPSPLSTCGVCGGAGTNRVPEPYVTCLPCSGAGVQPFTRLTCLGCRGKGVRPIKEPTETCPVCGGTGTDGHHLCCLRCEGAGVVTKEKAPAQRAGRSA